MVSIQGLKIKKILCPFFSVVLLTGWIHGKEENCDFWGTAKIRTLEVNANHTIQAFDKLGNEVESDLYYIGEGNYAMHVLGEPAYLEGTPITFCINGEEAQVVSGSNVWNEKGSKECNLEVAYPSHSAHFWAHQPDTLILGDSIHVYDTSGSLCGYTSVSEGGYFSLYVAGDDTSTIQNDEGANNGEVLIFTVNNDSAVVLGVSSNNDSVILAGGIPVYREYTSARIQLSIKPSQIETDSRMHNLDRFHLLQNYPNPFNTSTVIVYRIDHPCRVDLSIFNCRGQMVCCLLKNESRIPGEHRIFWNGTTQWGERVSSGVYLYELKSGGDRIIRKMVLAY